MELKRLKVLNDNVLVAGEHTVMRGGVYTGTTIDDKPQEGKVLKVGPGRLLDDGSRAEMWIKEGMKVLFNEHSTTKFLIGSKTYYVLREEDVVGFEQ